MISTERMTWVPESCKLLTEISDHGPGFQWIQVWPDACDVGVDVRSHKTGRVVRFVVVDTESREGEIVAWHLKPAKPSECKASITIFND